MSCMVSESADYKILSAISQNILNRHVITACPKVPMICEGECSLLRGFEYERSALYFDSAFNCRDESPFMRLALTGCLFAHWPPRSARQQRRPLPRNRKELIQAINADDSAAIQATFDAQMQQALPPEKSMPFFRGLVTAKGKLKEAGTAVSPAPLPSCESRPNAEHWDFKILWIPRARSPDYSSPIRR